MQEEVASNVNYNLCYCFYLPAIIYYALIISQDIGSCWLLFLTLISFTSVLRPSRHKLLHILMAISITLDFLVKILISMGLIVVDADSSYSASMVVMNNLSNLAS